MPNKLWEKTRANNTSSKLKKGNKLWEQRRKLKNSGIHIDYETKLVKIPYDNDRTRRVPINVKRGVGTELHKIYSWFGFFYKAGCGCEDMELRMNEWGSEGCIKNMDVILKHIHKQCSERGIPYIKALHIRLIKLAIKRWDNQTAQISGLPKIPGKSRKIAEPT